jgi:hypothetical protein
MNTTLPGPCVFGEIGSVIAARAAEVPLVVRVRLNGGAVALLDRPFELAYAGGHPLALAHVSFVYETASDPDRSPAVAAAPGDRLRMLAVFSLPTDAGAIGVRRERQELTRLVQRIAASGGPLVDLRARLGAVQARHLVRMRLGRGGGAGVLAAARPARSWIG